MSNYKQGDLKMKTYKVINASNIELFESEIESVFPTKDGLQAIAIPNLPILRDYNGEIFNIILDIDTIKLIYKELKKKYNDIWMTRIDRGSIPKCSIVSNTNYTLEMRIELEDITISMRDQKIDEILK